MNQALQIFSSSAATTADNATRRYFNADCNAVDIIVQCSSAGSATLTLQGLTPGSTSNPYTILLSTAITTTGTFVLRAALGTTVVANQAVNAPVPMDFAVALAFVSATPTNLTVGMNLIHA